MSKMKKDKENRAAVTDSAKKKDRKADAPQMKVVIRHLPPSMSWDQFLDQISPIPPNNYLYFARGDTTLGPFAYSRAYINFTNIEELLIFKEKFDGYVFVDSRGNEYPAIVEFAPSQKVPRRRLATATERDTNTTITGKRMTAKKRDSKSGTIENDAEYIAFLKSIEEAKNESSLPSAEVYLEEMEARDRALRDNHGVPKIRTPLIEHIIQRRANRQREREERREMRKAGGFDKRMERDGGKIKILKRPDEPQQSTGASSNKSKDDKEKDKEFRNRKRDKDRKNKQKFDKEKKQSGGSKDQATSSKDQPKGLPKSKEENNASAGKEKENRNGKVQNSTVQKKEKKESHKYSERRQAKKNEEVSKTNLDKNDAAPVKSAASGSEEHSLPKEAAPKENASSSKDGAEKDRPPKEPRDRRAERRARERIKNKDRPAQEIYRPGARKNTNGGEGGASDSKPETKTNRTKVFSRSRTAKPAE